MSWGYWGIVTGLLVMLTLFFFCMDILYGTKQKFTGTSRTTPAGTDEGAGGKRHAA
jgi:hypothetical protein